MKERAKRYSSFAESSANFEWNENYTKRFSNLSLKSNHRFLSIQASSNCQPDIWGGQVPLLHHRPTQAHRRYVQNWGQHHWYRFWLSKSHIYNYDIILSSGKGAGELNLIILIPKTEARAQGDEVSSHHNVNSLRNTNICDICFAHNHVCIKYFQVTSTKILQDRVGREDTAEKILKHYRGKMSSNVKKVGKRNRFWVLFCANTATQVRLNVEVFNLRTNEQLGHGCSQPICDSSSKVHNEVLSCASGKCRAWMNIYLSNIIIKYNFHK